jgi:hypothetical protein
VDSAQLTITLGQPLAMDWSGFHDWLEQWAPLAEWSVAAGTLALAIATFVLARSAQAEAAAVRDEATRLAEQAMASLRAYVYPESDAEWARGWGSWLGRTNDALPLRNGGPGVALNVEGRVRWPDGAQLALYGGSIAPGQAAMARPASPVSQGWINASGELRYADLNGDRWVIPFKIKAGEGGQLVIEHEVPQAPAVTDRAALWAGTAR